MAENEQGGGREGDELIELRLADNCHGHWSAGQSDHRGQQHQHHGQGREQGLRDYKGDGHQVCPTHLLFCGIKQKD